jgi:hypothetical protein
LFRVPVVHNQSTGKTQMPFMINSSQDLEKALVNIVSTLTSKSQENDILLETLVAEVHKQYGEGITKILKRLKLKASSIKFLQSSSAFKLHRKGKSYCVAMS